MASDSWVDDMALSIATQVHPAQVNTLGGVNPMELMRGMFEMRNMQQQYQSNIEAGQIMAASPDMETAIERLRQSPNSAWMLPMINQIREGQLTQAHIRQTQWETDLSKVHAGVQMSTGPDSLDHNIADAKRNMMPENGWLADDIHTSLFSNLPTDPAGRAAGLEKNRVGLLIGSGLTTPEAYGAGGYAPPGMERVPGAMGGPDRVMQVGGVPMPGVSPGGLPMPGGAGGGVPVPGGSVPSLGQSAPAGPTPATGPQMQQWADLGEHKKAIDTSVDTGMGMLTGVNEAEQLLKRIQPGALSSIRAGLGSIAQSLNATPEQVRLITGAGNDIDAVQEYEKLVLGQVFGGLNQSLPPGSRLNEREFTAALRANPNPTMQRDAILRVYDNWKRNMVALRMEQNRLPQFMAQNANVPGAAGFWNSQWANEQQRRGLLSPFRTMDGKGGIPAGVVLKLLADPDKESREKFDKAYGPGASARYLD